MGAVCFAAVFVVSTIIILVSSVSMQWAIVSIKKNNLAGLRLSVLVTLLLGTGFLFVQYSAWSELVAHGINFRSEIKDIKTDFTYVPAGKETVAEVGNMGNVAASFLYVITGLHVAHLLGGILALSVVLVKSLWGRYSSSNYNGVQLCAIYWHFLDALWIYLFLFLLYIR